MSGAFRLAVDIGGTFTDVVLDRGAEQVTTKVLTTYDDPADAVMTGIDRVCAAAVADPGDASIVLHGTTLATNALIERSGAVTALLTTVGHRDAVEMALENRFEQYDINIDRPKPLVPRHLRLPVTERLAANGDTLVPLDEASVRALLPALRENGVESVAIGFLHAYADPGHEERAAEIVAQALPDVSISLSSSVCPEIREYERLSTTCANAYVKPLMGRYLESLEAKLHSAGFDCPVLLMTSGGGLTTLTAARAFPIRLVESGPAGGTILASRLAREGGFDRALSFDMGGTTAKLCVIDEGRPLYSRAFEVDRSYRFKKGSGLPVRIPVIEMVEIGAGGGSIAGVDALGRVQVGPESAGSEPGPASYGRGGTRATVTDADVVLGKLDPAGFAGGRMTLDTKAAADAVSSDVGEPLRTTVELGAHAVSEVVNENMAAAARAHLSEWGRGLPGRTLVAFGGAAPLHAVLLAHKLKLDTVLIPRNAGVGSAVGFLLAPVSYEVVRSRYMRLDALDLTAIEQLFAEMRAEAHGVVGALVPQDELEESRQAYMRYLGQGYEVAVELDPSAPLQAEVLRAGFEAAYQQLYGRVIPGLEVEILSWTLTLGGRPQASGSRDRVVVGQTRMSDETRRVFDVVEAASVDAAVFERSALAIGDRLLGPALVTESQTTVFVASGFDAVVSDHGHLVLTRVSAATGGN